MVAVNSANYDDSLCSHDGAVSAKDTEVVHIRQSGCFTLRKGEESFVPSFRKIFTEAHPNN